MKFFQSIRWQLQLWYGVMLFTVLCGFGITTYRLESTRQIRRTDEELQQRLPILVNSQRPMLGDREKRVFKLSQKDMPLFEGGGADAIYYVVWLRHGEPVTRSANAPLDVPQPKTGDLPNRNRGQLRETFLFPGPGDCVLVGRSISQDLSDLHQFAWWLTAVGGAVLILGLSGGAWVVSRALRPIRDISNAAEKIAAGDLTRRINDSDPANELGQLVTVLNSTFARLDTAFSQQSRFTADAAHELRTPLAVILSHTQNGLASDELTAEHREAFEATHRAAQRMRRLTESLLTLARLDFSSEPLAPSACRLDVLVRECIEHLAPLAAQQQITINHQIIPTICNCVPEQIQQVLTNLVSNAICYNRPTGTVMIHLWNEDGYAIITIIDDGRGILPADLPHIFERFYRADKSRNSSSGQSGLGLAIVQAILDAHGGSITVTSTAHQGSTFTVRLPLEQREKGSVI